ncbi:hypothetical protein ACPPVU_06645 [Mucilaginibacter sp. McL0603]|uniref:hypothetical protein n=1 Tax=Mucilaginibacter sp. McL0603 TaxID=3415670 RepID=UPI003CE8FE87
MKNRIFKIVTSALFLVIFLSKMAISLAPLFSLLNPKAAVSVMQLDDETKTEKEEQAKDALKEKKLFDDQLLSFFEYSSHFNEVKVLHTLENSLYIQTYHPVVPTPPPNA